ncbi:proline-rich receptor-like protein kinase PERK10 isoform X2 [Nymphaea colorata]|uniref:proline-rich receptor-like protein kinase PERK10 isoform X2 n=1 Tax=Nymphaea colorata TaxID=210225 RepID=UPI00129E6833|nr:proline-rich receptor-like protein kinase PERK10 isoform X2 [Nymphaea colorata]
MACLSYPAHDACDLIMIKSGGNSAMVIHVKRNLFSFWIAAVLFFASVVDGQFGFEPEPSSPSPAGEPPPYLPTLPPDSPPAPPDSLASPPSPPESAAPPPAPQSSPSPGNYGSRRSPPPPPPDNPVPTTTDSKGDGEGKTPIGTIVGAVVAVVVAVPVIGLIGVAIWRKYKQKPAKGYANQPGTAMRHSVKAQAGPANAGNGTAGKQSTSADEESTCHAASEVSGPGTTKRTKPAPATVNFTYNVNNTENSGTGVSRSLEAQSAWAETGNGTAAQGTTSAAKKSVRSAASEVLLAAAPRQFAYNEILSITGNFGRVIGKGGSSTVYYGELPENGLKVAVKKLRESGSQFSSLLKELEIMVKIHHKNLVSLVGLCKERHELILVYDYMANGSLLGKLEARASELTWRKRLEIALDAATGLEYLHTGCSPAIIHRDIKPANILLDEKLQAKLADFGLSKAGAVDGTEHTAYQTKVAGTKGYIDPEYLQTQSLTKKSDVYSFGVVLFELITGKPAMMNTETKGMQPLAEWIVPMLRRENIENLLDPLLKGRRNLQSAWKVAEIARAATQRPAGRPDMPMIVSTLKSALRMETSQADEISISESMPSQYSFDDTPRI